MCDESARVQSDEAVERQKVLRNSLGYHNLSYLLVYTFRDETACSVRKTFNFETEDANNAQKKTQSERF